jgi:hypothetical protein
MLEIWILGSTFCIECYFHVLLLDSPREGMAPLFRPVL